MQILRPKLLETLSLELVDEILSLLTLRDRNKVLFQLSKSILS